MQRPGVAERTGARVDEPVTSPAFTALAWAAGLATTAMILGTPYLLFGYHSPSLHLVLDSVDSCISFLLAYLLYGRFLRSRRLQDLLLAEGLFVLGLAGLGLSVLISLLDLSPLRTLDVWLPLSMRVVAALLIAASALVGSRPAPARWARWATLAPWVFAAVTFAALWLARDVLPPALDPSPPASAQRPVVEGHWALLTAQALTAACFLVASLGFMRQAMYRHDELVRWLGPACALGGFARVNYVLFPSLYSSWVYTGDLLRTGCYVLLLVGAAREIGRYWSAQARAAVLEDRLDEARAAIDTLGRGRDEPFGPDEPLGLVLHRAARHVAERYGGRVFVDVDDSIDAEPEQRHALVRITREAVSNAIRHGSAGTIRIRLERDQHGRRLVVQDDGRGFDLAGVSGVSGGAGHGLTSMRERAAALPGAFEVFSRPGEGTTVSLTW